MILICQDNPRFEETGKLIQAAKDLNIEVEDEPLLFEKFFLLWYKTICAASSR